MQHKRGLAALAAFCALVIPAAGGSGVGDVPKATVGTSNVPTVALGTNWVGSWATAPVQEGGEPWRIENQSLRMIAHLSLGGSQLRVRLTNAYGTAPVTFAQVRVARRTEGAAVDRRTDRPVHFGGEVRVVVQPGKDVVSDPVRLPTRAGQDVAVSMHVESAPGGATRHPLGHWTHYSAKPGTDVTKDASGTRFPTPLAESSFLTGVDVYAPKAPGAVVAFGDSITDDASFIYGPNGRWTEHLARRLAKHRVGVVNSGIAGNTVTFTADDEGGGEPAVVRFDRDVLTQSGARALILFEGTNDLARGIAATELINGLRSLADRARAKGLTVVGATILPRSCGPNAWDAFRYEPQRAQVNNWIRSSDAFAAVADLDAALRNPKQPECLNPRFDSGDGLHPNQEGMRRIAEAMPLDALAVGPAG